MRGQLALGLAVVAAAACPAAAGNVWFVDRTAPPWGNGQSWATAYQYLQDALTNDDLDAGDEIRVAAGTYMPDETAGGYNGTDDQDDSFELVGGVTVLGGFPVGGGPPSQRDPQAHATVLSGHIYELEYPPVVECGTVGPGAGDCFQETPGVPSCVDFDCCAVVCDFLPLCCLLSWDEQCVIVADTMCPISKSLHVVRASGVGAAARLDGFVIRDGWAGGQPEYYNYGDSGSGMLVYNSASPVVTNCIFESGNSIQGGALAVIGSGCNPLFVNCRFIGNVGGAGGAVYVAQGGPTFVNCIILSNTAQDGAGGGVYATQSATKLINCLLLDNLSTVHGSATYQVPWLVNCIVWSSGSSPIDSAVGVTNSCVEGGHAGAGNIAAWPLFADALHGNYRLLAGSPCINAGVGPLPADLGDLDGDLNVAEATPRDLGGGARALAGAVDIGPYEHCAYDLDANGSVGTGDLLALLGAWGGAAGGPADLDHNGVVTTGDLLLLIQHWYDCGG